MENLRKPKSGFFRFMKRKTKRCKRIRIKKAKDHSSKCPDCFQDHWKFFRHLDDPYDIRCTSVLIGHKSWKKRKSDYWIKLVFDFMLDLSKRNKADLSIGIGMKRAEQKNLRHSNKGQVHVKYANNITKWNNYKKQLFFKQFVVSNFFDHNSLMVFSINRSSYHSDDHFKIVLYHNGIRIASETNYDDYRLRIKSRILWELNMAELVD